MENSYVPEIYVGENGNWFINGVDTGTKAQGDPGKDGLTPNIGADGFWYIGEMNTGVRASGNDGISPHIGTDGFWYSGERNTLVKAQGEKGDTGAPGIQGPRGDKGDNGTDGAQGIPGEKGEPGVKGETGSQGLTGATGPQGMTGPKGDTGVAGPQGCQGPKGDKGETGATGIQGLTGAAGPQGRQGAQGQQGIQGPKGDPGPVNIANNLDTTAAGYALDARQGRAIKDIQKDISSINSKLPKVQHGQASTVNMNGFFRQAVVTFPEAFTSVPGISITVVTTKYHSTIDVRVSASLVEVTKTGFTAVVQDAQGQLSDQGYIIKWIAISS